jgi:hypothetical protein
LFGNWGGRDTNDGDKKVILWLGNCDDRPARRAMALVLVGNGNGNGLSHENPMDVCRYICMYVVVGLNLG